MGKACLELWLCLCPAPQGWLCPGRLSSSPLLGGVCWACCPRAQLSPAPTSAARWRWAGCPLWSPGSLLAEGEEERISWRCREAGEAKHEVAWHWASPRCWPLLLHGGDRLPPTHGAQSLQPMRLPDLGAHFPETRPLHSDAEAETLSRGSALQVVRNTRTELSTEAGQARCLLATARAAPGR